MRIKKSRHSDVVKQPMSDGQVEGAAGLFRVLAEPARLYLLRALMEGEQTVGELVERTGLKQGTASKHLGILYAAGFLERSRRGACVYYAISDPLVKRLCGLVCDRMAREAARQYERLSG